MEDRLLKSIAIALVLVLIAVVSFFFVAERAGSAQSHSSTITSLDEKAETVLKLTATATLASIGISAIPDDTATPIADKLTDFVEYFLLILCVLYAEKYLLTILGAAAFKVLIPVACGLGIVSLFWRPHITRRLAMKLAIFGLAIFLTIPLSINVSDQIYEGYKSSIDETIAVTEEFTDETAPLAESSNKNIIETILKTISETVSGLSEKASRILNRYVEALAIMIVTSCIIPILVLVFFLWLIKMFTGLDLIDRFPVRPPVKPPKEGEK